VEDTAVVFDDVAVIARPGARSRRGEVESTAAALRRYRTLAYIQAPGTLDGGDVLVTPRRVFVGITERTNADGARQLAALLAPYGVSVTPVSVTGCLHLKSAGTMAVRQPEALLINPRWVDPGHFGKFNLIEIDPAEPFAANVLVIGDRILCAREHPGTRRRLEANGLRPVTVPAGELAKAEGGVTCCSLLLTSGT